MPCKSVSIVLGLTLAGCVASLVEPDHSGPEDRDGEDGDGLQANPVVTVELRYGEADGHNETVARAFRFELDSGCIHEIERIDPRGSRSWESHDCSAPDQVRPLLDGR